MNGNTKIGATNTTVAYEAMQAIRAYTAVACHKDKRKDINRVIEELVSEAICTADISNPTKVRDMIGCYLNTMSDAGFVRFQRDIRKYVNE